MATTVTITFEYTDGSNEDLEYTLGNGESVKGLADGYQALYNARRSIPITYRSGNMKVNHPDDVRNVMISKN